MKMVGGKTMVTLIAQIARALWRQRYQEHKVAARMGTRKTLAARRRPATSAELGLALSKCWAKVAKPSMGTLASACPGRNSTATRCALGASAACS